MSNSKLTCFDFYSIGTNAPYSSLKLQEARSLPAQEWLKAYVPVSNAKEILASLIELGWQVLVLEASRPASDKVYINEWFVKHDLEIDRLEIPGQLPLPAINFPAWRTRRALDLSQQLKVTELLYVYSNSEDIATMQRELVNARRSYDLNWREPHLLFAANLENAYSLASRLP